MNRQKLTAGLIAGLAVFSALAPTTHADPPAGSGWDLNPDVIIGGGSDTTWLVSLRLEQLYNSAPGCAVVTSGTSVNKGKCSDVPGVGTPSAPTGPITGNYDHDLFVSAAPTGSGAGKGALSGLSGQTQYNPAIDYARSSSGPGTGEAALLTFWGFARDAIAVTTFGTRSGYQLTKQNLADIYSCNVTRWENLTDSNNVNLGLAPGDIIPWDMNTSSGTRSTFTGYLPGTTFGACVRKLTSGTAPLENDVKPILADAGTDGTVGTADDNANNYIWWMSFGTWSTYPYAKNGIDAGQGLTQGNAVKSNLVALPDTNGAFALPSASATNTGTYAILRTLFQVTRNGDADCRQTAASAGTCDNVDNNIYGATSGKAGAVRQFTQFLCSTTNLQMGTNPFTGRGYRSEVISALNAEGFQQVPAALRTAGYSCAVNT